MSKLPEGSELEEKTNHLLDAWFQWRYPIFFITLFISAIGVTNSIIEGNWQKLFESPDNIRTFFSESLWPPDWSVIEPQAYPVCEEPKYLDFTCSTAWIGVLETLKIAFVATNSISQGEQVSQLWPNLFQEYKVLINFDLSVIISS